MWNRLIFLVAMHWALNHLHFLRSYPQTQGCCPIQSFSGKLSSQHRVFLHIQTFGFTLHSLYAVALAVLRHWEIIPGDSSCTSHALQHPHKLLLFVSHWRTDHREVLKTHSLKKLFQKGLWLWQHILQGTQQKANGGILMADLHE